VSLSEAEKLMKAIDKNASIYDPGRKTVGAIYRDAQIHNKHEDAIEVGDMGRELTTSLIDDINGALKNFDVKGTKPYYLMVHEKKDLQMKQALARRMLYFGYRPWPEDDTVVFWKNPKTQELRFCWALPHWSEMQMILANESHFDEEFIYQIKAWMNYDLKAFGFYEHPELKWVPNPRFKDKRIEEYGKNKPVCEGL
jgi:hypothetical protein